MRSTKRSKMIEFISAFALGFAVGGVFGIIDCAVTLYNKL